MATNSIADSLSSSLGLSYGLNVSELVSGLVSASRTPRESQINSRISTNEARISALASAKSSLTTFSSALTELMKSSAYKGQPASNNTSVASVALLEGGVPTGLPAQIEVRQLAGAQVLSSATVAGATATAGTGTLTFTTGPVGSQTSFDVTLTSPANTLADLAKTINDKKGGITASVVTDSNGARLVLKGETGTAKAFTVSSADGDANLQRFVHDGTTNNMTLSQTAKNAQIRLDNVDMEFTTNEVTTAIPYLRINLNSAAPGTTVTLATDQPVSTMKDLVEEFVSAFNNLKKALNSSTQFVGGKQGLLANDSGIRDMANRLAKLTSTELSATGPYKTLGDLGISTNKDGTLVLDTKRLDKVLADNPEAVTQMLNPAVPSAANPGLAGTVKSIADYVNGSAGPLAGSTNIYQKLRERLQEQLEKLDDSMGNYEAQLTKSYTAMQTKLTAFKATQAYLTNQIEMWNNSGK